jgi:hypothetical protein
MGEIALQFVLSLEDYSFESSAAVRISSDCCTFWYLGVWEWSSAGGERLSIWLGLFCLLLFFVPERKILK